jgi:hypothetical protein
VSWHPEHSGITELGGAAAAASERSLPAALPQDVGELLRDLARAARDVGPAVPKCQLTPDGGRVVTAHVAERADAVVTKPTVQLNDNPLRSEGDITAFAAATHNDDVLALRNR